MPSEQIKPFFDDLTSKTCRFAPLGDRHGLPKSRDKAVARYIVGLFLGCRPSDIARPVVSIAVNSINGMLCRGARSDLFEELSKTCEINADSSSAIDSPVNISGIGASVLHSPIGGIFNGAGRRMPFLGTAARCTHSSFKSLRVNRYGGTTIAQAQPFGFAFDGWSDINCCESPKSTASEVFSFHEVIQ